MLNLVFIHGAGDDHRAWHGQREFFSGSHGMLDVDLAGHRHRLEESPFDSHEESARDVLGRMDAAGMSQAVLIGHSAGGAVAMTVALQHPERVLGLVLVATAARLAGMKIAAPTLVVGGSDDRLVPVSVTESLAASIPGAQLEAIVAA